MARSIVVAHIVETEDLLLVVAARIYIVSMVIAMGLCVLRIKNIIN